MNSFYETELNESNDMSAEFDEEAMYSRVSTQTPDKGLERRDIKKAPAEKAKEKLWESIVADA